MSQSGTAQRDIPEKVMVSGRPIAPATVIGTPEQVTTGSVLIRPGTALPHGLAVSLRRMGKWNLIAELSALVLDRMIRSEGWHLFFMVPPVVGSGLGLSFHSALRKALADAVRQVEMKDLNALEIKNVRVRQLLKVHYARIIAHPRHVRDSPFLRDPDPYHRVEGMWNFTQIFHVRNRKLPQRKGI